LPFLLPHHYSCPLCHHTFLSLCLITLSPFSLCPLLCHHSHCAHGYFYHLIVILIILSSILPSWHFIVLVKTKLGQLQTTMSHSNQGLGHVACVGMAHGHPSNICDNGRDFFGNSGKEWWDNKARLSSCTCYKHLDPKFPWPNKKRFVTWQACIFLIWHSQWPS
jgi:hypothetical protein